LAEADRAAHHQQQLAAAAAAAVQAVVAEAVDPCRQPRAQSSQRLRVHVGQPGVAERAAAPAPVAAALLKPALEVLRAAVVVQRKAESAAVV
jgi:hypothetical protein